MGRNCKVPGCQNDPFGHTDYCQSYLGTKEVLPTPTSEDYERVLADHRRLVRELDVLLFGEDAAEQASLCDIVALVRNKKHVDSFAENRRYKLSQALESCLNTAFEADPAAMYALITNRVPCTKELVDHPHVVVDKIPVFEKEVWQVGMMGVIAGICTAMGIPIVGYSFSDEKDEDGRHKIVGFKIAYEKEQA